jgi:hypothetical protein
LQDDSQLTLRVLEDKQTAEADNPGTGTYTFDVTASDGFLGSVSHKVDCTYINATGSRVTAKCTDDPCTSSKRTYGGVDALPLGEWEISCSVTSQRTHLLNTENGILTKTFVVKVNREVVQGDSKGVW